MDRYQAAGDQEEEKSFDMTVQTGTHEQSDPHHIKKESFDLTKRVHPVEYDEEHDGEPKVSEFSSFDLSEADIQAEEARDNQAFSFHLDESQDPARVVAEAEHERSVNESANASADTSAHNRYL